MQRLFKSFIFDFIACAVALGIGILMLPTFGIGIKIVHSVFALLLVVFMLTYLADRIRRKRGYAFITACIEFALLAVIVILLFLGQFNVFSFMSVCGAFGFVLWVHGVLALVSMYLSSLTKRTKYSFISFLIFVGIVSLGVYLFASPIVNDKTINVLTCVVLFVISAIFLILGIFYFPTKKNGANSKSQRLPEKKSK